LLAVLYRRYQHFNGDVSKGLVVIPTELIPGNAATLRSIIFRLADQNNLEDDFKQWLQASSTFCNSLVDRIVPGKLPDSAALEMEQQLGYNDELMMMSETYGLWAIEAPNEKIKEVLSFHRCDEGVVITRDITKYRELKLRLLNGSHTFTCGLAFLSGFTTVKEAMANAVFESFITGLMMNEIVPSINCEGLKEEEARSFANRVLDRFRNPFMAHQWLNITLQYSAKMNTRNAELIKEYVEHNGSAPAYMSLGLAAWIRFMKCQKAKDGKYYGEINGQSYLVNDDHAAFFESIWKQNETGTLVEEALGNRTIWQFDLGGLKGLTIAVSNKLKSLADTGPLKLMQKVVAQDQSDNKPA
jgi:tagaturonate reductase